MKDYSKIFGSEMISLKKNYVEYSDVLGAKGLMSKEISTLHSLIQENKRRLEN